MSNKDWGSETPLVGSVNLTAQDLSEAVAEWVIKKYGAGVECGRWEAHTDGRLIFKFTWITTTEPKS
jgi:hypothetical protein